MPQVTKKELEEINQELTETIQRLDEENQELMEQVKTGVIEDMESERDEILSDLRSGRRQIEKGAEALKGAITRQRMNDLSRALIPSILCVMAVAGTLWIERAGIDPRVILAVALAFLVLILTVRYATRSGTERDLDEIRKDQRA